MRYKKNFLTVIKQMSTDVYLNLATEEYLYESLEITSPVLFLWRNDKTIIFGKH